MSTLNIGLPVAPCNMIDRSIITHKKVTINGTRKTTSYPETLESKGSLVYLTYKGDHEIIVNSQYIISVQDENIAVQEFVDKRDNGSENLGRHIE